MKKHKLVETPVEAAAVNASITAADDPDADLPAWDTPGTPVDPNPLGVDIEKVPSVITGGEGHGSGNARQLVVIQKLTDRSTLKPAERMRLLDPDIREAMALAARRINNEAMKYSVAGFTWDLDDIVYDMGAPRTVVATLRIARSGA